MSYRLTKIYTRQGDNGTTGLGVDGRISKDDHRIATIGDIDELNSYIGLLIEEIKPLKCHHGHLDELRQIQHDLFDLGGELAMPGHTLLDQSIIKDLETCIDLHNDTLPPLRNFILPGGSKASAHAHIARTLCRKAERTCVTLNNTDKNSHPLAQQYLNRLSDYLFVLARQLIANEKGTEILWQSRHQAPKGHL